MRRISGCLCLILSLQPVPSRGQAQADAPSPAPETAWARHRHLRLGTGFFNDLDIYENGRPLGLESFAGNADALFADSAEARRLLRVYRQEKILGTSLYVSGLTLLLAEVVYSGMASRRTLIDSADTDRTIVWSGLGVGFVLSLVGAYWGQSAKASFVESVEAYNRDLMAPVSVNLGP